MNLLVKSVGHIEVAAGMVAQAAAVDKRGKALLRHWTQILQTRVQGKASGRPGPRAITGDYRRSIVQQVDVNGPIWRGVVGTNAPQGRRLEFGFHGTDSLGRNYNQPPYPHFGPAMDEIELPMGLSFEEIVSG